MGSSRAQTKTVTVFTKYTCPNIVNKDNWIGGDDHDYTFSVQQREMDIVVTRTDFATGWGMDLRFQCCGTFFYTKQMKLFS